MHRWCRLEENDHETAMQSVSVARRRLVCGSLSGMRGDADTGERTYGNDYYQDMMLWAMPSAVAGQDLHGPCAPGGVVDRVLQAARGKE